MRGNCTDLSIGKEPHGAGDLGGHVDEISGAQLQCGRLVARSGGDGIHAPVITAATQESQQVSMTHVFHYHEDWLCKQRQQGQVQLEAAFYFMFVRSKGRGEGGGGGEERTGL